MTKKVFFLSAVITLCSSLLIFSRGPRLVIMKLEDLFVLLPDALAREPIATFLLILSLYFFYKTIKFKQ